MEEKDKLINHEMMILARESRGLTQSDLAKRLAITQSALSRIESGLRGITNPGLKQLSEVLGYPVSFFTQTRPIYGVGLVEVFHRKRQNIGIKTMNKIYSLIDIRTSEISRLLKGVDIGDIDFPTFNIDDFDCSATEIARLIRAKWRLPHGPVQNLTSIFENARGIIVPFDFKTSRIDAVSHWLPGLPPLFFMNKYVPTDRMRFTLSHELGHIMIHQKTPSPEIERQANEFAAEFLMPDKDIRPYLVDLSIDKLASLKPYWKVSMSALLKRSVDLEAITARHGRTLWMQLSKAGYKVREPMELDLPPEIPTLLKEIVNIHIDDMGYGSSELASMIRLYEKEFQEVYLDKSEKTKLIIKEAEDIIRGKDKN